MRGYQSQGIIAWEGFKNKRISEHYINLLIIKWNEKSLVQYPFPGIQKRSGQRKMSIDTITGKLMASLCPSTYQL
jgi:hypothetical protein